MRAETAPLTRFRREQSLLLQHDAEESSFLLLEHTADESSTLLPEFGWTKTRTPESPMWMAAKKGGSDQLNLRLRDGGATPAQATITWGASTDASQPPRYHPLPIRQNYTATTQGPLSNRLASNNYIDTNP